MYKLFRFASTVLLAAALSFRGVSAILADGNDGKTEPVALILRSNSDVEQNGDDDDDDDTPSPTDDDGFDTPLTDYDGIDTPATDNDGVDTPLSTDGDGINTPYTDYDGVDVPGVPTLRANASVTAIELTWNATAAADSYQLWRWEQTNGWRQIGGGNLNATAYTDDHVAPGTTYIYTVRAVSGDGESSAWSAYASATAQEPGSLTAAPVLSATAGTSQVDLSWNALPGASRYELWAWDSENGWEQIGGANLTGTSFQHSGASSGVTYTYTIRALAGSGSPGPWSQYVEVTVADPSSTSTSTPTSTPSSTATATPTATKGNSPPNPPGVSLRSSHFTATPTPTATLTPTTTSTPTPTATTDLRLQPPDTDNDGVDTTDNDGIDTTDNDGTDSDGIDTPSTTDNDGTDSDGIDTPTPT
ncbi:MAG: fibronectin type III domain-containing protein, partial [Caldilineaceae bacterium SB0668_bin_21]|nr:fibronectin type III domain-containing protein [Caldilineaceae bacterium SB0668_bin_21]